MKSGGNLFGKPGKNEEELWMELKENTDTTHQATLYLLNLNFSICIYLSIFIGFLFPFGAEPKKTWFALTTSCFILVFRLLEWIVTYKKNLCSSSNTKLSQICFLFQCLGLSITLPAFYFAIAAVVQENSLPLHDELFLSIDEFLAGWLFPLGQFSLWIDAHPFLNPSTILGKILLEFLQIIYVSYYFWGYLLMLYFMLKIILSWWKKDTRKNNKRIIKMKILMVTWFASYLLTFLGNILLPGISPRIYLQEYFTHQQNGFGFSRMLDKNLKEVNTFATFPSGHVGETFVIAFCALKLTPKYGKLTLVVASFVAVATLWCRYHYLIDVLSSIPIILLSLTFGMIIPNISYQALMRSSKQDFEFDEIETKFV